MVDLVSVVIPTYNRKDIIHRAIDSCLAQTYPNIEIVICDDRSEDDTVDYLKERYKDKCNIFYCSTPIGKKGANAARNEGIRKARGKYIAFLDSDDYLLENSIQDRMEIFKVKKYGLVYGNVCGQ